MSRAETDPIRWAWQCGISNDYQVEILPSGQVRPGTGISDKTPIEIVVRKAVPDAVQACGNGNGTSEYFAEINGTNMAEFFRHGLCSQRLKVNYDYHIAEGGAPDLKRIEAAEVYGGVRSLLVARDDADWRFTFSSTDLLTSREARRLRVAVPNPRIVGNPDANISILSGECVMTSGQ